MSPTTPAQAIAWRCWDIAWKPFLLTQLGLLTLSLPTLGFFAYSAQGAELNEVANAYLFFAVMIFWGSTVRALTRMENGWRGNGYLFQFDFVQPVSIPTLILAPLAILAVLWVASYVLPALLFHFVFGTQGPAWYVCLTIVALGVGLHCLNVWSSDDWSALLGWLVIALLYVFDIITLGLEADTESGALQLSNPANVLWLLLVLFALLALAIAGVSRQRHGEELLPLGRLRLLGSPRAGDSMFTLPFTKGDCPIDSPWRAQLWFERRFRGLANHALWGASVVLLVSLFFGSLRLVTAEAGEFHAASYLMLIGFGFGAIFTVDAIYAYGFRYSGGTAEFSEYQSVRPLHTLTLVSLKFLPLIAGLIVALVSGLLTMQLLGPLLVADFAEVNGILGNFLTTWLGSPVTQILANLVMVPTFVLAALVSFASMLVWINLNSRATMWFFLPIPAYLVGLFLLLFLLEVSEEMRVEIILAHGWLIVIFVMLVTLHALRCSLRDHIIDSRQLGILLAVCGGLLLLHYLQPGNALAPDTSPDSWLEAMLGFTLASSPLFAAALGMHTMNHVLHR